MLGEAPAAFDVAVVVPEQRDPATDQRDVGERPADEVVAVRVVPGPSEGVVHPVAHVREDTRVHGAKLSGHSDGVPPRPVPCGGVTGYLKRLVSSLAAYQVADVVSKFIAVLLLPVYTRYITPSGYGVVELLSGGVIFASIVVRFGIIEAFLRYFFIDEDQDRRDALVRRATVFLLVTTTIAAGCLAAAAEPLSKLVLGHRDTTTFLIAVLGLWTFTNLELAYGLLRVEERLRAYVTATLTNVLLTIALSVILVVVLGQGARGLLLGNYAVSTVVLFSLWWTMRERLLHPRLGPHGEQLPMLLRFGLPTVPAEISFFTGATEHQVPYGSIAAASVVISVPLILLVLLFQKRIVAGLTAGAVKG